MRIWCLARSHLHAGTSALKFSHVSNEQLPSRKTAARAGCTFDLHQGRLSWHGTGRRLRYGHANQLRLSWLHDDFLRKILASVLSHDDGVLARQQHATFFDPLSSLR